MLQEIMLFLTPFFLFFLLWFYSKQPTNNKPWRDDVSTLPKISIDKQTIRIDNLRDFKYSSQDVFEKKFYSKTINISDIQTLDYFVEPFMKWRGISHTLISFGLKDGDFISVSVEVRKTTNQKFSFLKTFFKQFELTYVMGSERDLIQLRTSIRKDPVFLLPIKADTKFIQKLFLDIIKRANTLQEIPEYYHPWFNSCTSNLIDHVNNVSKKVVIHKSPKTFFPGYTLDLVFDLHYVLHGEAHQKDFEYYLINEKALKCKNNFSKCIRSNK